MKNIVYLCRVNLNSKQMKTSYKNYEIETTNGSSFIYLDGILKGCTHSDLKLNNSELKAKKRIDDNKLNMVNTKTL